MLVYLKDVELSEVQIAIEQRFHPNCLDVVLRDSDFTQNRGDTLSRMKRYRQDVGVLAVYDIRYLKWGLLYQLFIYLASRKKAYILDSVGHFELINLLTLLKFTLYAVGAVICQITDLIRYRFELPRPRLAPQTRSSLSDGNKIVYIRTTDSYNLKAGGALGHTLGMIDGFTDIGYDVHYMGVDKVSGLKCENIIVPPSRLNNLVNLFNRYSYDRRFLKVVRPVIASNSSYQFIYHRASRDSLAGVRLAQYARLPLVLEFNSFLGWELSGAGHSLHTMFTSATTRIERVNLKCADLIVTVSQALYRQLTTAGVAKEKILVLPNAVDGRQFYDDRVAGLTTRKQLGIPCSAVVVGFSGTFGFWHGTDILTQAIKNMVVEAEHVHFLFIGDGPLRRQSETSLSGLARVTFAGLVPYSSINNYLSACDVLVSPHNVPKGEEFIGSPTKLFEYMACGKVIVASDIDQVGEVVSPSIKSNQGQFDWTGDEVGVAVEPGSVESLEAALRFSVNNIEELRWLGKNAREKALRQYSWKQNADAIHSALTRGFSKASAACHSKR